MRKTLRFSAFLFILYKRSRNFLLYAPLLKGGDHEVI